MFVVTKYLSCNYGFQFPSTSPVLHSWMSYPLRPGSRDFDHLPLNIWRTKRAERNLRKPRFRTLGCGFLEIPPERAYISVFLSIFADANGHLTDE